MSFKSKLLLTINFLILLMSCNQDKPRLHYKSELDALKKYHVILMAGQSNMVGLGDIKNLKNDTLPDNIVYFNHGTNTSLKVLHHNFGPEVGLSWYLNKHFPDLNFVLVKYAIGGSEIEEWVSIDPDEATSKLYYSEFKAFSESKLKGFNTKITAFLWMQGEDDILKLKNSLAYERHFLNLITTIRKDFNDNSLPIIYGEVSSSTDIPEAKKILNNSQLNISKTINDTYYIRTSDLEMNVDNVHFSNAALQEFGNRFGSVLENIIVLERDN
jgi:hypothetical protein